MDRIDYRGLPVLITGAQGFIGSWLAEELLDRGARVIVPQRQAAERSRFRQNGIEARCELAQVDLGDLAAVMRVVNEDDVRVVFHLAARTIVGEANRTPLSTYEANLRTTCNVLEACRLRGEPPAVVIASSYHAYGAHAHVPYSEDADLRPSWPYDVSKACADMIARCYAATYGLPVAVTRLANVYGGGDLNFSRIVPDTARALVRGDAPVIRSDGTPERDYLYVGDAVDAYLAIAESLRDPQHRGRAWNAGSDTPTAVAEVVRRMISASGRSVEAQVLGQPNPRDEIDRQYLDSSAIREELGWKPRCDLERGLGAAYAWYERNLN